MVLFCIANHYLGTIYNWELKLRFLHKIKRARIVSFIN